MNQAPLYQGKAKQIWSHSEGLYTMRFTDCATAFNAKKKADIAGKGILNRDICYTIYQYLEEQGIATHLVEVSGESDLIVKQLKMIPVEVIVRNISAGSLCKRLGIKPDQEIKPPIMELNLKSDPLDDPLINEDHITWMKLASPEQIQEMKAISSKINEALQAMFLKCDILLADFKVEFGVDANGKIVLGDEITPDGCRLWDKNSKKILDKDVFRRDLGSLTEAYEEVYRRLSSI
ncbi:phosphoribosylaminoimidazolesuccinocarboxamide synthase [bacterium]|nr:phosphoribosylaminoimidazolesuccinocarboxamide synthase [bacterium]